MILGIRYLLLFIIFVFSTALVAQTPVLAKQEMLSFEEYMGYVKQHHPLMKQANLKLSIGEATLLKARGGFDPKVEIDHDRKKFKETEYYDLLNTTFKIPSWYGIEFKTNFEQNKGAFINPDQSLPQDGLYSARVSFSLAQGFLINERMAILKKAKFFQKQTEAERELLVSDLIFEASNAYFVWLEATNEENIYTAFLTNASNRFNAVKRRVAEGDIAAIDSVEAKITLQNRQLNLEVASLKRRKAILKASNYLWLNDIPVEIQTNIIPIMPDRAVIASSLVLGDIAGKGDLIGNHPKIRSLDYKIEGLTVDRALKINKLLPKLDLQYNFLNPEYNVPSEFNTANYKAGIRFSTPIFLRKERGDAKLAKLKLQDANFERSSTLLTIQNKIAAIKAEIESLERQNNLVRAIVKDYETLVSAEERKFYFGESSLFLVNSREKSLIDAQLRENQLIIKFFTSQATLYNQLGLTKSALIN